LGFTKKEKAQKPAWLLDFWRRGWDSNPRVVSHKLISSQPRYDRFDTSPHNIAKALYPIATAIASKEFCKYAFFKLLKRIASSFANNPCVTNICMIS
jgi:hypothetical protein